MSVKIKTVDISSGAVRCAVFGSGSKPLVIIPGLSIKSVIDSADEVARAYSVFNESHTIYLIDRRSNLEGGTTINDIARDTAEAMCALGISGADVFGTSLGGMVAQLLAIKYPELVSKLALGSTAARINPSAQAVIERWIALASERRREELCRDFIDKVYSAEFVSKYGDFITNLMSDCTDDELDQLIISAESVKGFDVRRELSRINCPVLVLGAENDGVLTGEASREIADILGCELYMYGAPYNHAVYDEAPDYKDRLINFFER